MSQHLLFVLTVAVGLLQLIQKHQVTAQLIKHLDDLLCGHGVEIWIDRKKHAEKWMRTKYNVFMMKNGRCNSASIYSYFETTLPSSKCVQILWGLTLLRVVVIQISKVVLPQPLNSKSLSCKTLTESSRCWNVGRLLINICTYRLLAPSGSAQWPWSFSGLPSLAVSSESHTNAQWETHPRT